jgi:hypothetical protein
MLFGDFSAKVGNEDIFKPTNGNESLNEMSNDNEITVVNFATSINVVVRSTIFPRHEIHKYSRTSPDGETYNQAYLICDLLEG